MQEHSLKAKKQKSCDMVKKKIQQKCDRTPSLGSSSSAVADIFSALTPQHKCTTVAGSAGEKNQKRDRGGNSVGKKIPSSTSNKIPTFSVPSTTLSSPECGHASSQRTEITSISATSAKNDSCDEQKRQRARERALAAQEGRYLAPDETELAMVMSDDAFFSGSQISGKGKKKSKFLDMKQMTFDGNDKFAEMCLQEGVDRIVSQAGLQQMLTANAHGQIVLADTSKKRKPGAGPWCPFECDCCF